MTFFVVLRRPNSLRFELTKQVVSLSPFLDAKGSMTVITCAYFFAPSCISLYRYSITIQ